MELEKLKTLIDKPTFFARRRRFLADYVIDFSAKKDAESITKEFFQLFLIAECIHGINYSDSQLRKVNKKIEKILSEGTEVSSEDLPLLEGVEKNLDNVIYRITDTACLIEEKPAS